MNTIFPLTCFSTPEPLELLKIYIDSGHKISLGAFLGQNHTPMQFLRMLKWIILNFRQTLHTISWHSNTNSYCLRLETCLDLKNFYKYPWRTACFSFLSFSKKKLQQVKCDFSRASKELVVFYDFVQVSETYSEPNRVSEMETFAKMMKAFCKKLNVSCSSEFWICLSWVFLIKC